MNILQIKQFAPQIQAIAKKYAITNIYVFGSVARGDMTENSDVDFMVELQPDAALFGVAGFQYECEKLLEVRVDVVPLPLLGQMHDRDFVLSIQNEAVLL